MIKQILLICIILFTVSSTAQNNLLSMLEKQNEPIYVNYLFKGTKVVSGQSVELTAKHVLQFNIQHRFGPLNSGAYNLYGLDFAKVRLSLDYGIFDWMSFSIGRSSSIKIIDSNVKLRLKRQIKDGFPLTIVANSSLFLKQWNKKDLKESNLIIHNQFAYLHQFLIARKISRNLTLQLSPTLVHHNLIEENENVRDKFAVGFGGRKKITKRISINAESFYQLNDKQKNNVFSLGFDIETGGHVFQLHLSNSPAMIESEFISNTNGEWLKGDIYFGFNISRVFLLK